MKRRKIFSVLFAILIVVMAICGSVVPAAASAIPGMIGTLVATGFLSSGGWVVDGLCCLAVFLVFTVPFFMIPYIFRCFLSKEGKNEKK